MVMQPADELVKLLRQTEATTPERWEEELKAHSQWCIFLFSFFLIRKWHRGLEDAQTLRWTSKGPSTRNHHLYPQEGCPFQSGAWWFLFIQSTTYNCIYCIYIYINTCAYRCIGVYVYQKMHMCMHMYMSLRGGRSPKLNWRIIYFGILRLYWGLLEVGLDVL